MTPAKGITMSRIHAEDLRSLHQHIDELVKLDGVKGFDFSLTVYLAEGVARALPSGRAKSLRKIASARISVCWRTSAENWARITLWPCCPPSGSASDILSACMSPTTKGQPPHKPPRR